MRILHLIGAILVLIASPAIAKDVSNAWIVAQKSGDVRVLRNGVQPASVQVRAALSAGDIVATGTTGRAMLTRGDDYVVVAPSSRLMLPKEEQQTGFTRLIQQVGTMLYKVRHTGVPHFAVDTPMLAAVVKGTTFTVVVDKDQAAVQVTQGLVEVSSLTGDARRLVEGGMTVYIGRKRPNEIIEVKPGGTDLPTSGEAGDAVKIESSGDVPLSTITSLMGGLVREAPTAPIAAVANSPTSIALALIPTTGSSESTVGVGDTTVPPATQPVVDVVETVVAPVTEPVVDVVDTVVASVTEPVVDVVETVVAPVTEPVVDVVETVVTPVTEPVIDVVETVVAPVAEPVVDVVETVVAPVTEPVAPPPTLPLGGL